MSCGSVAVHVSTSCWRWRTLCFSAAQSFSLRQEVRHSLITPHFLHFRTQYLCCLPACSSRRKTKLPDRAANTRQGPHLKAHQQNWRRAKQMRQGQKTDSRKRKWHKAGGGCVGWRGNTVKWVGLCRRGVDWERTAVGENSEAGGEECSWKTELWEIERRRDPLSSWNVLLGLSRGGVVCEGPLVGYESMCVCVCLC